MYSYSLSHVTSSDVTLYLLTTNVSTINFKLFFPAYQNSEGKLTAKHAGMNEDESLAKKRKTVARVERPVAVAAQYRAADVSDVKQVSQWRK